MAAITYLESPSPLVQNILDCSLNGVMFYRSVRDSDDVIVDFRLSGLNAAARAALPFSPEEALGHTLLELFPSAARTGVFDRYREVVMSGQPARFETTFSHPRHDATSYLAISAVRLDDGLVMSFLDVTTQRHTEETLLSQSELMERVLENSRSGIMVLQPILDGADKVADFRLLLTNQAWLTRTGLTKQTIAGRTLRELFPHTDQIGRFSTYVHVYQTGEPYRGEHYYASYDSWADIEVIRIREGVMVTLHDVTDSKKAELQRLRQTQFITQVLDNVPSGIVVCSPVYAAGPPPTDFQVTLLNAVGEQLLGVSRQEALGHSVRTLALQTGEPALVDRLTQVWTTGQPATVDLYPVGSSRWFTLSLTRFEEDVIIAASDITSLRRYQHDLEHKNQELLRSNANLQQFAYVASHDLQEPLRKIQSFGDVLQQQYATQLPPPAIDLLQRMQSASRRMAGLIQDLLVYSRISAQQQPFGSVSLDKVVSEVLSDLEIAIREKQARIDCDHLPVVAGDPLQLRQLFQNLLSNALKFSRPGLPPEVSLRCRQVSELPEASLPASIRQQPYYRLEIRDNGIGFDEKYLDRIFQLFQRLHGKTNYTGTGIGLAICKKVVENHHGYITAQSQSGSGATFTVYLPASGPDQPR